MTLPVRFYPEGMAGKGSDVSKLGSIASRADDAVLSVLAHVRGTPNRRGVLPLVPGELVVPSTTAGRVTVRPAHFIIGGDGTTPTNLAGAVVADGAIALSATQLAAVDVSIAANTSGSDRYDLVFATLAGVATESVVMGYKSVTDGALGSRSFVKERGVAMTVAASTGGSSAPTGPMYGLTDPTGAYRVPLAIVRVPAHADPSISGVQVSDITPVAPRVWVRSVAVGELRPATGPQATTSTGGTHLAVSASTAPRVGFGSRTRVATVIECALASSNRVVLDDSIDWRHRVLRITAIWMGEVKPAAQTVSGNYGPDFVLTSPPFFVGPGATEVWEGTTTLTGNNRTLKFGVPATTGLVPAGNLTIAVDLPMGTDPLAHTEYWYVEVEATDPLDGR